MHAFTMHTDHRPTSRRCLQVRKVSQRRDARRCEAVSLRHDHRSETISFRRSSIASSEKKRIYRARPTHHDDRLTRPHPVFPRGRVPRGEGNALGASFTDDTVWPPPANTPPAKVRFRKPTFFGPRFAPVPAQPTIAFFFTKKKTSLSKPRLTFSPRSNHAFAVRRVRVVNGRVQRVG